MHDLHSILLKILDVLSTSSDYEVGINLKLSINLIFYVIFIIIIIIIIVIIITFFLNWYEKSDIFFHIIPNTIKFAFKLYC